MKKSKYICICLIALILLSSCNSKNNPVTSNNENNDIDNELMENELIQNDPIPIIYDNPIDAYFIPMMETAKTDESYRELQGIYKSVWKAEFKSVMEWMMAKCRFPADYHKMEELIESVYQYMDVASEVIITDWLDDYGWSPTSSRRNSWVIGTQSDLDQLSAEVYRDASMLLINHCSHTKKGAYSFRDIDYSKESYEDTESSEPDAVEFHADPEGKLLYHSGDESFFPLYAMIPSENIYLYGIEPNGGMVLYHNEYGTYFRWPGMTPRMILPELRYHDFDNDGKEDLAVTLYYGSGTGLALMDLHIVKFEEEFIFDNYSRPLYIDYPFYGRNVKEWMKAPMTATVSDDNNYLLVNICGEDYTVQDDNIISQQSYIELTFGDIVIFYFEDNKILAKVAIGAMYEEYATPDYFGDMIATVVFDGENFMLEDYIFTLY